MQVTAYLEGLGGPTVMGLLMWDTTDSELGRQEFGQRALHTMRGCSQ